MTSELIIDIPFKYEPDFQSVEERMNLLKNKIFELNDEFWCEDAGTVLITHYYDPRKYVELEICPNAEHGVYLRYRPGFLDSTVMEWLSVRDKKKLDDELMEIEYSNECYASVGLFLSSEQAWIAIDYFIKTKEKSPELDWIDSAEMPEDGNF
jgi:hypothetical protein